jgi:cysteine synthase A
VTRPDTVSRTGICESIAEVLEGTPITRLGRVAANLACAPLAVCTYVNRWAAGDALAAVQLLRRAEAEGRIVPGDTIVAACSGEPGVGLAMAAASAGYRLILTVPEGVLIERQHHLEQLGVWIVRTPAQAALDAPEGPLGAARWLATAVPRAHLIGDGDGVTGAALHEALTADAVARRCGARLDVVVVASGERGLGGVARALTATYRALEVVVVDVRDDRGAVGPLVGAGSPRFRHESQHGRVSRWTECTLDVARSMARRLARHERLLVGPLSGAVMWAALRIAAERPAGHHVVAILPDAIDVS